MTQSCEMNLLRFKILNDPFDRKRLEDHIRTRQVQKETLVKVDDVVAAQYHLVKLKRKLKSPN